jgi:hypothetical protein
MTGRQPAWHGGGQVFGRGQDPVQLAGLPGLAGLDLLDVLDVLDVLDDSRSVVVRGAERRRPDAGR